MHFLFIIIDLVCFRNVVISGFFSSFFVVAQIGRIVLKYSN